MKLILLFICELLISFAWVYLFSLFDPQYSWLIFAVPLAALLATIPTYIYLKKRKKDWIFYVLMAGLPPICMAAYPLLINL